MNKESLEKLIKPSSIEQAANECANSFFPRYKSKLAGYRVCTLSDKMLCKYSVNEVVNHSKKEGVVIDRNYPGWYRPIIVDYRYSKCSKGVMPVSEFLEKVHLAFAFKLVKGYWHW